MSEISPISSAASTPASRSDYGGVSASPAAGFASFREDIAYDALRVSGRVPDWLTGSLLRIGPARYEVGSREMCHWFDGLSMLHKFSFENSRVSYAGRFLQSAAYRAAQERGAIEFSEFATDPCRSLFQRVKSLFAPKISDNANVNIGKLGARLIAMTETPMPLEFDQQTLDAAGVAYRPPGLLTTAHPHLDRTSQAMLNYAGHLGRRSAYRFFTVREDDTSPRVIASMDAPQPAYIHSFGLTERWIVLTECPFVVNPLRLAFAGRPYIENYQWKPERGTRFTLFDRFSGERCAGFETEPFFAFHHVNAYDVDGGVVVDICAYNDPQIVKDLYLEQLRTGQPASRARLRRFNLSLGDCRVTSRDLADASVELPRINYGRTNERPHRYVWGVDAESGWFDRVLRVDTVDETEVSWSQDGCYPGEPVFVARPNAISEDDGVVLTVSLDVKHATSALVILDAKTLDELARAEVPQPIPFSLHGQFVRS